MKKNPARTILILSACLSFLIGSVAHAYSSNEDNNSSDTKQEFSPKVSVIIPVHNSEPYLNECADSIENQKLDGLEIIYVNDASTDNSLKILEEHKKNNKQPGKKIIIIDKKNNEGVSAARNTGLDIAKGEYVTFVDSDDLVDLNAYETAYLLAHDHNDDVLSFGVKSFPYDLDWLEKPRNSIKEINSLQDLKKLPAQGPVWDRLYKREMLEKSYARFGNMKYSEDWCFNLSIRPWVKRMEWTDKCFYHYRQHPNSALHAKKTNAQLSFGIIPIVCSKWRSMDAIKGNESYLLSNLLFAVNAVASPFKECYAEIYSKHAQEILNSFGEDVYNTKSASKLSEKPSGILKKIKEFANEKDKNQIKVSIIVPVYNAEKYLNESLDSAVNQTLKDIEIICVNDASTDNSRGILEEYAKKDKRIVVIDKKNNEGANLARNAGLDAAKGTYIGFLDSDDFLDSNALEIAYKEAQEKNLDILSFGWESFPTESIWDKYKSSPHQKYFENDSINAWFYCGNGSNINIWNKLYKKKFLDNSRVRFKPNLKCAQDYYFNMTAFPKAGKIEFIPDKIYNYRRDSVGSISSKNKGFSRMQSHLQVMESVLENWRENGFLNEFEKKVLTLFVNWNMSTIKSIENCHERSTVAKRFLELLHPLIDKAKGNIEKNVESNLSLIDRFIMKDEAPTHKESNKIAIAMATDDNYLFPTIVSITSIMENAKKDSLIDFNLLLPGDFKKESKQKLDSLSAKYPNCSINIIDMSNRFKNCKTSSHITTPTYYRLGLPSILPNIDKILYMDVDIVVKKDLSELYNKNIDNYYIAGVDQPHTSKIGLGKEFLKSVGLVNHDEYVNAGILLMNLEKMRDENLENKLTECMVKNKDNKKWKLHDQDIMNEVCFDSTYYLPLKYNAMMHYYDMYQYLVKPIPKEVWNDAYENSTIVHFSSKNKPWNDMTLPKANLWWEYARKTDFINDINEKYLKNV